VSTTTSGHDEGVGDARQRVRQRRLEWARRGTPGDRREAVGPRQEGTTVRSDDVAASRVGTPSDSRAQRGEAEARAWSVNVELLDRERVLLGWTQRELARQANVDQGTLCDLLARRRRPTLGTVQAISTALGLTLAQVIAFDS